MIKIIQIFSLFIIGHSLLWMGTHFYLNKTEPTLLLVVDTSYAMKKNFPQMEQWINKLANQSRYQTIIVGTDKALLGPIHKLQSIAQIFRTAFGKMQARHLQRYQAIKAEKRILLSNGTLKPKGWKVVTFPL